VTLATVEKTIQRDLALLVDVLPKRVAKSLLSREDLNELLEVILDLGRLPEARFPAGDVGLDDQEITLEDLDYVVQRVGDFGDDNRAGIERTLHRISAIRNRKGREVGVTCRVGRVVFGSIKILDDLAFSGKNILLLGRPGVGKTTMLREMARVLADDAKKRVIIVDTSNEIAGDGDVPHAAIGRARRMQVVTPARQHSVMIEAVENHMPEVIIIDEMGTEQEAVAARTIAERGVQLIATAHGNTLDNLIMNPTLSDLIGGVQSVTLGDQEARYRGTQKTVLEREARPTFDVVVEIQSWERVAVHDGVASVVDQWLRGHPIAPEVRWMNEQGQVIREHETVRSGDRTPARWSSGFSQSDRVGSAVDTNSEYSGHHIDVRVFLFGVSSDRLESAEVEAKLSVEIVNELRRADLLLTTKTYYRRRSRIVQIAESNGTPVYVLRKNTMHCVQEFLRTVAKEQGIESGLLDRPVTLENSNASLEWAMLEAEGAANRVLSGEPSVLLTPQRAYVRRLQHLLAERFSLASTSRGRDPERAVQLYNR
jgi:stage III sporulation protein SpoIIIAA